jgi:hypothetical protein
MSALPSLGFVLVLVVLMTMRSICFSHLIEPPSLKIAFFPFFTIGLVILASIGTVSALWVTHFALLMPWPSIALVTTGWFILTRLGDSDGGIPKPSFGLHMVYKIFRIVLWGGFCLLLITNLHNTIRYHVSLTKSGGLSTHSDAIYDLSDWLANHAQGPVAAMDWGLAAPVTYLTGGQLAPVEVFGYTWESDAELMGRLESLIAQPAVLYLWRAPDEIIFDRSDEFKALYRPLNLEENIEEAFYEKSGRPLLGVTRLVEIGTAENPPQ